MIINHLLILFIMNYNTIKTLKKFINDENYDSDSIIYDIYESDKKKKKDLLNISDYIYIDLI